MQIVQIMQLVLPLHVLNPIRHSAHVLTRIRACEQLHKICKNGLASTSQAKANFFEHFLDE